jgi:hypothetical protein
MSVCRLVILMAIALVATSGDAHAQERECKTIVVIDLEVHETGKLSYDNKPCVYNGGWIIWTVRSPAGTKFNVKIKDWKFKGTTRKADVTKFKHFGLFDDGADEDTQGSSGGIAPSSTTVFVARAYYKDLEKGKNQSFEYNVITKGPAGSKDNDPEIEIQDPPVLVGGKKGTPDNPLVQITMPTLAQLPRNR